MAYRSSTNTAYTTSATETSAVPAGAAIDDIAIVDLYLESGFGYTVTPPAGFALDVTATRTGANAWNQYRYWKRLTAADTGTYTFSISGASSAHMSVCALFSGRVTSGSPFDVTSNTNGVATAAACPTVALTPVTAGVDLVYGVFDYTNGTSAATNPSGWTQATFHADGSSLSYKNNQAAAASGATSSASPASDIWTNIMSALRPAAVAAAVPPPLVMAQRW